MGDQLEFVDDNADVRLAGSLLDPGATEGDVLTVQADGSVAAQTGGGSVPFPAQAGDGSPAAAVVPTGIGSLYVDTTNGALYIAAGITDADWLQVGGVLSNDVTGFGVLV